MANFRSILLLIALIISFSLALYEDQVGKFDWKRSFIGKVKIAKFHNDQIVVTTEENVLASLSQKDGNIKWRQLLENSQQHDIYHLHLDREAVTVSGTKNSWFVRGWDAITGILLWEWTIYTETVPESSYWFVKNHNLVHVIASSSKSSLEVSVYQLTTGENNGKTTKILLPWLVDLSKCTMAQSYFACLSSDDSSGVLYYIDVTQGSNKVFRKDIHSLTGSSQEVRIAPFEFKRPAILIKHNKVAKLVEFQGEEAIPKLDLAPNSCGNERIHQLDIENGNLVLKSHDWHSQNTILKTLNYPLALGAPTLLTAHCFGSNCDVLLRGSDHSLSLLDANDGVIHWTREEALSNIIATEFFELPVSELDASIENEFKTSSNDVFSMFFHRLSTQTKQLSNYLFNSGKVEENRLVRDEFGLHKIIVVATEVGKLFGIDTITGQIIWSYRIPNIRPFRQLNKHKMLLIVQRTARYAPYPAQVVLLAKDTNTGNGVLFQFDPITGLSDRPIERLNYRIKQTLLLPYEDDVLVKPLVVVSTTNQVYVYPARSANLVGKDGSSTYLYTVDATSNVLEGYKLETGDKLELRMVWSLNLGATRLVGLSSRPALEHVHSQGKVLPDRSVYYKYVNPNMIALATLTDDPLHKHVLSVYLIDGITGLILYATTHKKAKGPVHLIHSENWIIYSFYSERFRRNEIATAELFEGHIQSNSSVFSSLASSKMPHVQTEAYILPASPQTMAVTLSERGITNKFLLIALSNGGVIEVPWIFLQPRFTDACGPEESCIPYMPEIPILAETTINYNQTLLRVGGIEVAPARLESTIHVLVHGLDLFYTRVAPSKTFDVLKEDFDHKLIVFVLVGLVLATYITKYLADKKALRQAWK